MATTVLPSSRLARSAVAVAFAVQGLTFASILTRLPVFKEKLDLSYTNLVMMLVLVASMSSIGSLLAGRAAGRWSSRSTLRWALVGVSLSATLPSFAGSPIVLFTTMSVYGVFVGAVDASSNMQGVAVQDRYGRSIMTSFHAVWSAAAVVGAAYSSLTIELYWPLILALGLISVVGVAANAMSSGWLLKDEHIDWASDPNSSDERSQGVPWLPVVLLSVPAFAMSIADSATSAWSGIYLVDGLEVAVSAAPIAYGIYQAFLLIVRLVGDRIVGKWGAAATVRGSGLIAVLGLILIVAAPNLPVVFVGFSLLGGGLSLIQPLSYVAAGHLDAGGGDLAVARVNVAYYLGYVVAALAIYTVAESGNHRAMFVVPLLFSPLIPLMASQFKIQEQAKNRSGSFVPQGNR